MESDDPVTRQTWIVRIVLLAAIVAVAAILSVPGLLPSRGRSLEYSAMASLRSIFVAQEWFSGRRSTRPEAVVGAYAASLRELADAGYLDLGIAGADRPGNPYRAYWFDILKSYDDGSSVDLNRHFYVIGRPVEDVDDLPDFIVDHTGHIREFPGGSDLAPPPSDAN